MNKDDLTSKKNEVQTGRKLHTTDTFVLLCKNKIIKTWDAGQFFALYFLLVLPLELNFIPREQAMALAPTLFCLTKASDSQMDAFFSCLTNPIRTRSWSAKHETFSNLHYLIEFLSIY